MRQYYTQYIADLSHSCTRVIHVNNTLVYNVYRHDERATVTRGRNSVEIARQWLEEWGRSKNSTRFQFKIQLWRKAGVTRNKFRLLKKCKSCTAAAWELKTRKLPRNVYFNVYSRTRNLEFCTKSLALTFKRKIYYTNFTGIADKFSVRSHFTFASIDFFFFNKNGRPFCSSELALCDFSISAQRTRAKTPS